MTHIIKKKIDYDIIHLKINKTRSIKQELVKTGLGYASPFYLGVAQIEVSKRLVLTQKCNRHANVLT